MYLKLFVFIQAKIPREAETRGEGTVQCRSGMRGNVEGGSEARYISWFFRPVACQPSPARQFRAANQHLGLGWELVQFSEHI